MQLKIFKSKAFICSLCILLLNDFILKYSFPNWLTGKLSDFAGLFIFALFWIAFFPKHQLKIIGFTAFAFLWWKSPWSQSFIHTWNNHIYIPIERVVDYSDLIALPVLFFSLKYSNSNYKTFRISPLVIIVFSAFAFGATSVMKPKPFEFPNPQIIVLNCTIESILEKEIYVGHFQADSSGVFKSPPNKFEQTVLLGDSIIMIKKWRTEIYNHSDHIDKKSGKVRFDDRIIRSRKQWLQDQLKVPIELPVEPIEFASRADIPKNGKIKIPYHSFILSLKDSFQIMTSEFGAIEKLNFLDSELHGAYTKYWNPTNVQVKGNYEFGLEQGTWEFFASSGVKTKEEKYEKGLLQKRTFFDGTKKTEDSSLFTKQQVLRVHYFFTLLFVGLFLGSLYGFFKFNRKELSKEKEKLTLLKFIERLLMSIVAGGVIGFCNFYIISYLFYFLEAFNWDLPTDLDEIIFWMMFSAALTFSYFMVTNRFRDILFLWLWIILIIFIAIEIQYLRSII